MADKIEPMDDETATKLLRAGGAAIGINDAGFELRHERTTPENMALLCHALAIAKQRGREEALVEQRREIATAAANLRDSCGYHIAYASPYEHGRYTAHNDFCLWLGVRWPEHRDKLDQKPAIDGVKRG